MNQKITVAVLDNHPVVRQGVVSILHQVCNVGKIGQACGAQGGLAIIEKLQPDIVILETASPGGGGTDCITAIRTICPKVAIIVFSADTRAEKIQQAIHAGAKGYILKTDPLEELQNAMQNCLRGILYLSPAASCELTTAIFAGVSAHSSPLYCLTKREGEIARHFSEGRNVEEVSKELFISPNTVRNHRKSIMWKLDCKHGSELLTKLHNLFHQQKIAQVQVENSIL